MIRLAGKAREVGTENRRKGGKLASRAGLQQAGQAYNPVTAGSILSDHHTVSDSDGNRNHSQAARRLPLTSPAITVASLFGAGFVPVGSGTIGSALALPLVEALRPIDILAKSATYLILFILFAGAAHRAGRLLGDPDHQAIVCDEAWAMAIVWEFTSADMRWMLASFVLFRVLDVAKPWPISAIDRNVKSGLGVMFDDALAAVATIVSVAALRWIIASL